MMAVFFAFIKKPPWQLSLFMMFFNFFQFLDDLENNKKSISKSKWLLEIKKIEKK